MQKYTLVLALVLSMHAISLWQTKKIPAVAGMHEYLKYSPKQVKTPADPIRWEYEGENYIAHTRAAYEIFALVMSQNNINSISDAYHDSK